MSRFERWSRAKRGLPVDDGSALEEDASPGEPLSSALAEDEPPKSGAPGAEKLPEEAVSEEVPPAPGSLDHTLPDPETLDAGSDFSAFMSPGVSSALRRRALRQLWSTGDYNIRDGLNDYDQDFKAQLKPMAADMADKVRQWSKRVEDALEEPPADDAPDTHPIEEGHQAAEEGKDAASGEIADSQEVSPSRQQARDASGDKGQQA
ncbi:MAG: DUF3306 domain-containing protein [Pseudomonadota bacterium]